MHLSRSLFSVAISELKDEKARIHQVHSGFLPLNLSAGWSCSWLVGTFSWLAGVFSGWLESFRLAGVSSWLAGFSLWLAGVFFLVGWNLSCLAGVSSAGFGASSGLAGFFLCWVAGVSSWLSGIFFLAGWRFLLAGWSQFLAGWSRKV